MKKYLLVLSAVFLLISCNPEKKISGLVLEDIRTGEIAYLQGTSGPLLYDSKDRLSNRVYQHIKADSWEYLPAEEGKSFPPILFNIPQGIKTVEFIKEWESEADLYRVEPFDENYFKNNTYLVDIYGSYKAFKKSVLEKAKEHENYEINEKLELVRYLEKLPEKRFTYRVETISGVEIIEVCFNKIESDWKVVAIFKKDF